jgi:hypothetical protein
MEFQTERIGLKLASAMLLHLGEISVKDIRAMPFFTNPDQIENVLEFLMRTFNAEIHSRRVASYPIPEWEQVIRLRK